MCARMAWLLDRLYEYRTLHSRSCSERIVKTSSLNLWWFISFLKKYVSDYVLFVLFVNDWRLKSWCDAFKLMCWCGMVLCCNVSIVLVDTTSADCQGIIYLWTRTRTGRSKVPFVAKLLRRSKKILCRAERSYSFLIHVRQRGVWNRCLFCALVAAVMSQWSCKYQLVILELASLSWWYALEGCKVKRWNTTRFGKNDLWLAEMGYWIIIQ